MPMYKAKNKAGNGAYSADYAGDIGDDRSWMPSNSTDGKPIPDKQPLRGGIKTVQSFLDADERATDGFSGKLPRSRN